ncbi:MAG: hypothetical protein WCG93_01705 [Paludibacter sp.]
MIYTISGDCWDGADADAPRRDGARPVSTGKPGNPGTTEPNKICNTHKSPKTTPYHIQPLLHSLTKPPNFINQYINALVIILYGL